MGQTVNLLALAFGGSNPSLPTFLYMERSITTHREKLMERSITTHKKLMERSITTHKKLMERSSTTHFLYIGRSITAHREKLMGRSINTHFFIYGKVHHCTQRKTDGKVH